MVISPEEPRFSPRPPDPSPEPSPSPSQTNGTSDLLLPKFAFPILKPRSKRRPVQSFPPPAKKDVKTTTLEAERPWKLRSSTASMNSSSVAFKKEERPRFSASLSSEEIEEDIYAVTGSLPRRRPKRRPRVVQKQIDMVFPGGWLTEVTVELYKVHDEQR